MRRRDHRHTYGCVPSNITVIVVFYTIRRARKERTNAQRRLTITAFARALVSPRKRTCVIPPMRGVTVDCLERSISASDANVIVLSHADERNKYRSIIKYLSITARPFVFSLGKTKKEEKRLIFFSFRLVATMIARHLRSANRVSHPL